MALQTFTAGQVLTAAQVNALQANDYNQTVSTKTADYTLVAADKGTRVEMNSGSATTITVNTDLFNAGDTLFIQNRGAGVCTITAGTATVSTVGSLALAQNAGGTLYFTSTGVAIFFPNFGAASGLTLIKTQTIGTAVSSVSVTNAFSATYENYKILISMGVGSAADASLSLQLGSNTAGYYMAAAYVKYSTSAVTGAATNNGSNWFRACHISTGGVVGNIDIMSPFLTKFTSFASDNIQFLAGGEYGKQGGWHNSATSFTDFTLIPNTGTITGGTIYVYGYQK
jgi:hypothetical protein